MTITASDHKTVGTMFGNQEDIVRVTYDFGEDLGTAGAFNLLTADGAFVITDFYANCITAFDSSGDAAIIDEGITSYTDILVKDSGQAQWGVGSFVKPYNLIDGNAAGEMFALPLKVADASVVIMTVKSTALTAGKCEFFFKIHRLGK